MAGGFPLHVNGVHIFSSEALYQACRFPHLPDVQHLIIEQRSPMTAKMKSKPHRKNSRADWDQVRVKIMRWCLHVKLAQNWRKFSELLLETGDWSIVEQSRKDDFWGAKPVDDNTLVGMNVLGRLLMELRGAVKAESRESLSCVQPLAIPDFLLEGEPIGIVKTRIIEIYQETTQAGAQKSRKHVDGLTAAQQSLFDESVVTEPPLPTSPPAQDSGVGILEMKPYSEYKESGLPWVGKVPSHWDLIPNRGLVRRRKVLVGNRHSNFRLLSLTKQGVVVRDISTGKGKFSSDMGTSQVVRSGDFVFCLFDVPETPRTVGLSRHDGMITGAYTVFEALGRGSPEYFELFYRAMDDCKLLSPLYSGLRNTIPADRFLATKTPQPLPDEQAAIVRFLDWVNERLERAIWAKRKLITLLDEQKQVIIHEVVTGRIDVRTRQPYSGYKDSGVKWLRKIPKHWELRKVKGFARSGYKAFTDGDWIESPYITNDGIRLIQTGNIGVGEYREKGYRYISEETYTIFDCTEIAVGDVLICRLGDPVGRTCLAPDLGKRMIASVDVCILKVDSVVTLAAYLVYAMSSRIYLDWINSLVRGSTRDRISRSMLGSFLLPFPSLLEQTTIVRYLDEKSSKIDDSIAQAKRQIDLLKEYRMRLISDVVTGKLDVREAAAKLPQEIDKPVLTNNPDDLTAREEYVDTESFVEGVSQ